MLCTLMYRSQPYMRILKIDIAISALFVRIQNYTPIENGTRYTVLLNR
jgi:hypothetical protein